MTFSKIGFSVLEGSSEFIVQISRFIRKYSVMMKKISADWVIQFLCAP